MAVAQLDIAQKGLSKGLSGVRLGVRVGKGWSQVTKMVVSWYR